ncbi:MAG TPA: DUF2292 domain-containing protein [Actinomycetota bacterium]|nr:DUF2292 domain-containing protein [Actinomycetota bacterium]
MTNQAIRPQPSGDGPEPARTAEDLVIEEVRKAVRGIEFGSVLIKIHQGEVVGIETSTKRRLADL